MAALAMVLRITGVYDHGFGVQSVIFCIAAAAGRSLGAWYVKVTGSRA